MKEKLESYKLPELKKMVRATNITGYSKLKKDELIKLMIRPEHIARFKSIKPKSARVAPVPEGSDKPKVKVLRELKKKFPVYKKYIEFYEKSGFTKPSKLPAPPKWLLEGKEPPPAFKIPKIIITEIEEPKKEAPKKIKFKVKKEAPNKKEKSIFDKVRNILKNGSKDEQDEAIIEITNDSDFISNVEDLFQNNPKWTVLSGQRKGLLKDKYLNNANELIKVIDELERADKIIGKDKQIGQMSFEDILDRIELPEPKKEAPKKIKFKVKKEAPPPKKKESKLPLEVQKNKVLFNLLKDKPVRVAKAVYSLSVDLIDRLEDDSANVQLNARIELEDEDELIQEVISIIAPETYFKSITQGGDKTGKKAIFDEEREKRKEKEKKDLAKKKKDAKK